LLPYIDHYGASNVLARAALANRPVIASNHHLLGSRVGRYKTGVTFRNNDSSALSKTLSEILDTPAGHFEQGLQTYAKRFKRDEFRRGLLAPAIRKEPAAS
ncbi:MAG: hypothetical protein U9P12_05965, partial [Verrucomicrobiota bacterium]|nr:hypothetical protein [Verrucomicrobiota bacterium]